jgi:hypothetical protein
MSAQRAEQKQQHEELSHDALTLKKVSSGSQSILTETMKTCSLATSTLALTRRITGIFCAVCWWDVTIL